MFRMSCLMNRAWQTRRYRYTDPQAEIASQTNSTGHASGLGFWEHRIGRNRRGVGYVFYVFAISAGLPPQNIPAYLKAPRLARKNRFMSTAQAPEVSLLDTAKRLGSGIVVAIGNVARVLFEPLRGPPLNVLC